MDTDDLARRAAGGDGEAFERLVRLHGDAIFRLALRMTGNADEAGELAQETFVRAFESMGRYDPDRPFFAWLYTICLNLTRSFLRRKRKGFRLFSRRSGWEETDPDEGSPSPEEHLLNSESRRMVQRGLGRLPVDFREAVLLRYMEGIPFDAIAGILGISTGAAKMRVYRGMERLRRELDAMGFER
jgi:RNA polymerase sigma factor (sigma-70 family)